MDKFTEHNVYTKKLISECVRITGKQPIGSKWKTLTKVTQPIPITDQDSSPRRFAEGLANTCSQLPSPRRFSKAMIKFAKDRCELGGEKRKLRFIDVRRAYFYVPSRWPVYATLTDEDSEPGMCGRLNVSMHGTQDAAAN